MDYTVGQKHVLMGVNADAYPIMGDALIQTLRENLGDRFTPAIESSWLEVYKVLSYEMLLVMETQKK